MLTEEFKNIISQFQIPGEVVSLERFGSGNINDTYRSVVDGPLSPRYYIHQKISQAVFPSPEKIMENMALVTNHIQKKLQQESDNGSQSAWKTTLELIPTKEGRLYHIDACGEYWRTTAFIPNAMTYDVVRKPRGEII